MRYAGAGFVISHFKTGKVFRDGKEYSIFTAELCAVLMASSHLVDFPCRLRLCLSIFAWTLLALNNADKFRSDIIFEIKYILHCSLAKGTIVDLCWAPSHCGLLGNSSKTRCLRKHPIILIFPCPREKCVIF